MSAKTAGAVPSKEWAEKLKADWLRGVKLGLYQVLCASEALDEMWVEEGGKRRCVPIYGAEDEALAR
jgi:hypothetical protein